MKNNIFTIPIIVVVLFFFANYSSAQTIQGTSKWQWLTGNYIEPINSSTVSGTNAIFSGNVTGTNGLYAGNILGLNGTYLNSWSDLSGIIDSGGNPFNQELNTTNTPEFAGLTINGNATTTGNLASYGGNSDQWNTAFSWGNHALAGYLLQSEWETTTTDALAEGSSNFYYTDDRVATYINNSNTIPTTSYVWDFSDNTNATEGDGINFTDDEISLDNTGNWAGTWQTYDPADFSFLGVEHWLTNSSGQLTPTGSIAVLTPDLYFDNATGTNTLEVGDVYIPSMDGDTTYRSINDWFKLFNSAGRITGGEITKNDGQTYSVAAGTGLIRVLDDDVSQVKFIDWSASSTIDIATNTAEYVGVEYNGGSPRIITKSSVDWNYDTEFPLGSVLNQNGDLYDLSNPWWISDGLTNVIERFQAEGFTKRDDYVGGLIIGVTGTRNPTLSAGTVWSRLNEFEIDAKDCSTGDTFYAFYRDGAGGWLKSETASTTYQVTYYDDNNGEPELMNNNYYANWWVFAEIDADNNGQLMLIYPQNQYSTVATAEAEEVPTFPTPWYEHGILLGRILFKQGTDAPIEVQSVFSTVFNSSQATNHANLSNLNWASSGHTIDTLLDMNSNGIDEVSNLNVTDTLTANITSTNAYTSSFGINSEYFTDLTGTGLNNMAGVLGINLASDLTWTGTQTFTWLSATTSLDYWFNESSTIQTLLGYAQTAYDWGDHAVVGYLLQSEWEETTTDALAEGLSNFYYTEDRFDTSYNATTTLNGFTDNSTNWNTAYSWGDHALAGYLIGNPFNQQLNTTNTVEFVGMTLSGISGSTQCLNVDTNGVISGTGSECGVGSGSGEDPFDQGLYTTSSVQFLSITTTDAYFSSLGLNSEYFTDFTGTGLSNVAGALGVDLTASFDWTGTHSFADMLSVSTTMAKATITDGLVLEADYYSTGNATTTGSMEITTPDGLHGLRFEPGETTSTIKAF